MSLAVVLLLCLLLTSPVLIPLLGRVLPALLLQGEAGTLVGAGASASAGDIPEGPLIELAEEWEGRCSTCRAQARRHQPTASAEACPWCTRLRCVDAVSRATLGTTN